MPLFSAPGQVNQNKRVPDDLPALPQKVGSTGDRGEALQRPEGSRCSIAHAGQHHVGRAAGGWQ